MPSLHSLSNKLFNVLTLKYKQMARIIRHLRKVFSIQERKQEGKNKFRRDKNCKREKHLKIKETKKSIINILRENMYPQNNTRKLFKK